MLFLPLRIDGATSSFKAPLVVLQDRTGNCPIQTKRKQCRLRSYCHFTGFISEKLTFEMPCISIATFWLPPVPLKFWRENSQHRRQLQLVENARIVSDTACFGFDRAFCLTDFTSCQYEIATCNEEKFDTGSDLDKFAQIQQKPKYGFFTKTRFFSKKLGFFHWTYNFLGLSSSWYIYIYSFIA